MPLVHFFETSFGRTYGRDIVLIEVAAGGISGWGEVTAGENPFYNEEWTDSVWLLIQHYIAPRIIGKELNSASDAAALTKHIRGHKMAQGGLEAAVWDLEARQLGIPLWQHIGGGARREIPCGVSIGVQDTVPDLIKKIAKELADGYQRIKMKIKPGWDVDVIREVRREFPNIKLMADANSAYTLADVDHLTELDAFDLIMLEQPLGDDDLVRHATLQRRMRTPICLDESITSVDRAEDMIALESGRIINIKPGRVGGLSASKAIHDVAERAGIPVWCGGMLESGIGRAYNVALASLPNFSLPGDLSPSARYWARDIVSPEWTMDADGLVHVPRSSGLGITVDEDRIEALTVRREELRPARAMIGVS